MSIEILQCEQGSPEWYAARLGIPTASSFSAILAKGEGKTRRTYMMKLIGEIITGECAENYTNEHMERGKQMESEARDLYCYMQDCDVQQVGFIRNGKKGASPDSLRDANGAIELKTKLPHLQADVILADRLPPEHKAQCQGILWVAEREWIDFVSYWPKMPLFVKRVYRDEDYIATLAQEVDRFMNEMSTYLAVIRKEPLKVVA